MELSIGILILVILAAIFAGTVFAIVWIATVVVRTLLKAVAYTFKRPKPGVLTPPTLPKTLEPPVRRQTSARVVSGPKVVEPMSCPRDNCRQLNPGQAQFCRRCGMNLVAIKAYGPAKTRRELVA